VGGGRISRMGGFDEELYLKKAFFELTDGRKKR
jgi:hypothetical protein